MEALLEKKKIQLDSNVVVNLVVFEIKHTHTCIYTNQKPIKIVHFFVVHRLIFGCKIKSTIHSYYFIY